jgi:hypothetical protein
MVGIVPVYIQYKDSEELNMAESACRPQLTQRHFSLSHQQHKVIAGCLSTGLLTKCGDKSECVSIAHHGAAASALYHHCGAVAVSVRGTLIAAKSAIAAHFIVDG